MATVLLTLAGCGATTSQPTTDTASGSAPASSGVSIPAGAKTVASHTLTGESPSYELTYQLRAPFGRLYAQVNTNPPVSVSVDGNVVCLGANGDNLSSSTPLVTETGEVDAAMTAPAGATTGMDCHPLIAASAAGTTTLTVRLLSAP